MIRTIAFAWMLVISSLAIAESMPPTNTYEVSIYSLRLPVSPHGTVSLRECDDCDYHSIRVTPDTQYVINEQQLQLTQFRNRILDLRLHGDITVNVTRDETTETVVSMFVHVQ
jgi:hypothetical protein